MRKAKRWGRPHLEMISNYVAEKSKEERIRREEEEVRRR